MEAKQFRIGNFYDNGCGNIITVSGLTRDNVYFDTKGHVMGEGKPIPLTEDWLERFGFRKSHRGKFEHDNLPYDIYGGTGLYMHGVKPEIKHVHQLQNLYFALTGEELTLKTE